MKKVFWNLVKLGALIFIILSSGLALYIHYKGEGFDPVREIQMLRQENRRDEALDMAKFFSKAQEGDTEKIKKIEGDLEYTTFEKVKSFTWDGVIKGKVYDSYSGTGAIGADLFVVGDIRDLGIESWKYLTNDPEFDRLVMILSAAGIGFSSTPFINGCDSLAKNTIKYLKKIPGLAKKGVLKEFLSGKIPKGYYEKIWNLLKKTAIPFREQQLVCPISTM